MSPRSHSMLVVWLIGSCGFIAILLLLISLNRANADSLMYALTGLLFTPVVICIVTVIVVGIAALVAFWRLRRERFRRAKGLCQYCGYDLHGSAGDRCTECGRLIWRPRDPRTGKIAGHG